MSSANNYDPTIADCTGAICAAKSIGVMDLLPVAANAAPDDCENSSNSNDAAKTRRIKG